FGYRESVFKNQYKGQYIITTVRFRLSKEPHTLHTSYGVIGQELEKMGVIQPTIRDISEAVIRIRQSNLPEPKEIGNGGSFFKNPVLDQESIDVVNQRHPEDPFYETKTNKYQIPTGWLIENAGLQSFRNGDAGVHNEQALVLVNYGSATGNELLEMAR